MPNQASIRAKTLHPLIMAISGASVFYPLVCIAHLTHWLFFRQKCEIEVVDYSSIRSSARGMSNAEFVDMMTKGTYERPLWSKVRWINIGGVSWDVMSALAIKYGKFVL